MPGENCWDLRLIGQTRRAYYASLLFIAFPRWSDSGRQGRLFYCGYCWLLIAISPLSLKVLALLPQLCSPAPYNSVIGQHAIRRFLHFDTHETGWCFEFQLQCFPDRFSVGFSCGERLSNRVVQGGSYTHYGTPNNCRVEAPFVRQLVPQGSLTAPVNYLKNKRNGIAMCLGIAI